MNDAGIGVLFGVFLGGFSDAKGTETQGSVGACEFNDFFFAAEGVSDVVGLVFCVGGSPDACEGQGQGGGDQLGEVFSVGKGWIV